MMGWRTAWDERPKRRTGVHIGDDQSCQIGVNVKDHPNRKLGSELALGKKLTDWTLIGSLV